MPSYMLRMKHAFLAKDLTPEEIKKFLFSAVVRIPDTTGVIEFDAMIDAEVAAMTDEQFFMLSNELRKDCGLPPFSTIEECLKK